MANKEFTNQILQKHSEKLSQLSVSMKVSHTLYTEEVISKVTLYQIEESGGLLANGTLGALSKTITESPNKLRVFVSVLLQSEDLDTVHVANDILKEYGRWFIFDRKTFLYSTIYRWRPASSRTFTKSIWYVQKVMTILLQYIHS